MSRILSRHGNVIAADFRPRQALDFALAMTAIVLHQDQRVIVTRYEFSLDGIPVPAFTSTSWPTSTPAASSTCNQGIRSHGKEALPP